MPVRAKSAIRLRSMMLTDCGVSRSVSGSPVDDALWFADSVPMITISGLA
ncbi:MAG TPA: hypothetical protein VN137_04480 [Sphingomonas sp.]|nr:hypothetical protein [Sphingomonas sp.]